MTIIITNWWLLHKSNNSQKSGTAIAVPVVPVPPPWIESLKQYDFAWEQFVDILWLWWIQLWSISVQTANWMIFTPTISIVKYNKRARFACSRYASCYSLYICTRAFGPRYGGKLPLTIETWGTYVTRKNICHVIMTLIKSEYAHPIRSGSFLSKLNYFEKLLASLY